MIALRWPVHENAAALHSAVAAAHAGGVTATARAAHSVRMDAQNAA